MDKYLKKSVEPLIQLKSLVKAKRWYEYSTKNKSKKKFFLKIFFKLMSNAIFGKCEKT